MVQNQAEEMANKIKLSTLKVDQLNRLLQQQGLSVAGNKAHKIAKLMEVYEADEVDQEEIDDSQNSQAGWQQQFKELREIVATMAQTVSQFTKAQLANGQQTRDSGAPAGSGATCGEVLADSGATCCEVPPDSGATCSEVQVNEATTRSETLGSSVGNITSASYGVLPVTFTSVVAAGNMVPATCSVVTATQQRANSDCTDVTGESSFQNSGRIGHEGGQLLPPMHQSNMIRYTMREIISILPEFNPLKGYLTAEQFISKIEKLRSIYQWKEDEILFATQSKLKGVAADWADAQPPFSSWRLFVEALNTDFPSEVNVAELHREMDRRKRKQGESMKDYYYFMLNMGRRAKMDEASINSYIVAGLNDPHLSRTLLAIDLKTCNDLLKAIERLSTMPVGVKQTHNIQQQPQSKEIEVKAGHQRRDIRCFNCNETGHIAAKCPQPSRKPRCNKCNKVGHDSAACKVGKSTVASLVGQYTTPPPFMKQVKVWGKLVSAFVDTGSDYSLVAAKEIPSDAQREHEVHKLTGFGGGVVETKEKIKANAVVDGHPVELSMLVAPDDFMPYQLLLGRDMLGEAKVVIDSGVLKIEASDNQSSINTIGKTIEHDGVKRLLNMYSDRFSEDVRGIGRCKTTEMEIKVTTEEPIVGKRYQVPLAQRPVLSSIVKELVSHDIIQPSSSPHAAPVVLVKKANGEDRMCVDFRALNSVTVKKQFPMPIVEEQLARLGGNKWFTTLDMTAGYYQIPLKETSRPYTAFLTPDGLFEHKVMPFGLVNAPMVFQEMVINLIKDLKHRDKIINYVDEVIIATPTEHEGLEVLDEFLRAVRRAGLTLRPSKCTFMSTKVIFLGHSISAEGIRPGRDKVQCVEQFPTPTTATNIRQFLGLTGFFRRFIPGYSHLSRPLTKLLKKEEVFRWGTEQQTSFEELKMALTRDPVLAIFNNDNEHEVHTDASSHGLSGVLLQRDDGGLRPVQYFSRQCSAAESKYASHELEVLAIVETLERFRIYLLGRPFVVVTDCHAITATKVTTPLQPRIARWWLKLQEFDFKCEHRAGARMAHVDGLSRAPVQPESEVTTVAERVMRVMPAVDSHDWLYAMQIQDDKVRKISEVLQRDGPPENDDEKQMHTDYQLQDGRVYRKVKQKLKLVIPQAMRWRITKACHDDVGHFALEKTIERIGKHFWFPRIRRYVKTYINACEECCLFKVKGGKPEGQLHLGEVLPIPFRSIHIDHLGPFPKSKRGNVHIFVIVCSFSKYIILKPTRNTKSEPVVKALEDAMAIFGQPLRIVSDRGTAFTSKIFQDFISKYGIQHVKTAVRTPRANGQAERVNKTILSAIKCSTKTEKDWDLTLPTVQWAVNSQCHSVTKFCPNELIFNFNPRDVSKNRVIQAIHDNLESSNIDINEKRDIAVENINKERSRWKERYDEKHSRPHKYTVGDLVYIDYVPTATGVSHKLDPAFKGPYIITKVLNYDRYVVEDLPDSTVTQRKYCNVVSSDHMKPWRVLGPELDNCEEGGQESSGTDEGSGEAELSEREGSQS